MTERDTGFDGHSAWLDTKSGALHVWIGPDLVEMGTAAGKRTEVRRAAGGVQLWDDPDRQWLRCQAAIAALGLARALDKKWGDRDDANTPDVGDDIIVRYSKDDGRQGFQLPLVRKDRPGWRYVLATGGRIPNHWHVSESVLMVYRGWISGAGGLVEPYHRPPTDNDVECWQVPGSALHSMGEMGSWRTIPA